MLASMRLPGRLLFVLLAAAIAGPSYAWAADAPSTSQFARFDGGSTTLDGPWKFHFGDDSGWASPGFDDSGWENLTADEPWGVQGHRAVDGFAWYRRQVKFAPDQTPPENLSILLPSVEDAYDVYWNGRLVGSYGHLPPHPSWYWGPRPRAFELGPSATGLLAVRVWKAPFLTIDTGKQGGFYAPPQLGSPEAIAAAMQNLNYQWLQGELFNLALNLLYALVGLFSLAAWLRGRQRPLIGLMACYALSRVLFYVFFSSRFPVAEDVALPLAEMMESVSDISLWFLLLWLLDLRGNNRLLRLAKILAILYSVELVSDAVAIWGYSLPNAKPAQTMDNCLTAFQMVFQMFPFCILAMAVFQRRRLAAPRWVAGALAFVTQMVFVFSFAFLNGSRVTHWTIGETLNEPIFTLWGSQVNALTLSSALLFVALIYAVYQYSVESSNRQSALEQEYKNAWAVQQVLIPDATPAVRGFAIESVYKPAGEVGGDFFQILGTRDGGALVVIGDVSGKGMPAAMTVSLLVGTVRTLAHYTESPGEILAAMNTRMLGRSQGGFTTCLALRADNDGRLILANAGHLAPYMAGKELTVESGLPLGLSANAAYKESSFELGEGEQLTLLSDGVVEARSRTGELFGFERTLAIAKEPAEQIAQAAQSFGQQDDITVLTLVWNRVAEAPPSGRGAVLSGSMA
jgi:hypothetical protein